MNSRLRNFPANSSIQVKDIIKEKTQNQEENTEKIDKKLEINQNSDENLVKKIDILGELLEFLRDKKLMSTLNICKQIEKLKIEKGEALVVINEDKFKFESDQQKNDIEEFFKTKGLSLKLEIKGKAIDPLDELKKYFGEGLIIK